MSKLVVQHVITSLATGGAERMLERIVRETSSHVEHRVLTLKAGGALEERVRDAGAALGSLGVSEELWEGEPQRALELFRSAHGREDVVVGWLHHGNLAAGLRAKALGLPCVMNFRGTSYQEKQPLVLRLLRPFARSADLLLANSHEALSELVRLGFGSGRFVPNGFSGKEFARDETRGRRFREEHGIPQDALVIGALGRAHPMKNHRAMLEAVAGRGTFDPDVWMVVAGRGVAEECAEFVRQEGPRRARVVLLDEQADVIAFFSALDVYVHGSVSGEGFPNVIAEAMLCELPVVATDVAETRLLLGAGNACVDIRYMDAFAAGVDRMVALPCAERRRVAKNNREQILSRFAIESVADLYTTAFRSASKGSRLCAE